MNLICKELTIQEIALITRLATTTVDNYRRKIQKKVGAKNIVGVGIYALLNGLIESDEAAQWFELNKLKIQKKASVLSVSKR